jgi:hypothetical protein
LEPDLTRVRAACSSLQGDSKARGVLDRAGTDCHTAWFTTINKSYYSDWWLSGRGTRVEIAHV